MPFRTLLIACLWAVNPLDLPEHLVDRSLFDTAAPRLSPECLQLLGELLTQLLEQETSRFELLLDLQELNTVSLPLFLHLRVPLLHGRETVSILSSTGSRDCYSQG